MAKTKADSKKSAAGEKAARHTASATPPKARPAPAPASPPILLAQATARLQQGDLAGALTLAQRALQQTESSSSLSGTSSDSAIATLPALGLLGEIHVELGDIDAARAHFLRAARVDGEGLVADAAGGGAEKFLWLAQLSEEGGADSVRWYEIGARALRRRIAALLDDGGGSGGGAAATNKGTEKRDEKEEEQEDYREENMEVEETEEEEEKREAVEELRRRLATALCGVVEVYMTDLSWEADAEERCERLVTEATLEAPGAPEPWQTLANVRLSQARTADAQAALRRSLELWRHLPPGEEDEEEAEEEGIVPDFPTRVSLARLLMEAEMEEEALEVLERLVAEDDESVEVWYLGGWALYVMGEKLRLAGRGGEGGGGGGDGGQKAEADGEGDEWRISWLSSKQWLGESLRLFQAQDYEDDRLGAHAKELVATLDEALGGLATKADEDDDDEEWDGVGSDNDADEEMADA